MEKPTPTTQELERSTTSAEGLDSEVATVPPTEAESSQGNSTQVRRHAYFGDLHVHTSYSSDAYIFNVRATPDDAYRYAKGEVIEHVSGQKIKAPAPFDFIAVTDHVEYLGVVAKLDDPGHPLSKLPIARDLLGEDLATVRKAFSTISASIIAGKAIPELQDQTVVRSAWQDIIASAERHYKPGEFTTLVGYEWSGAPDQNAIHRNVIFRGGLGQVPDHPFSSLDSNRPEALWAYMEQARQQGYEVLSIPHNANMSNGLMFSATDSWGQPIDEKWASRRNLNEPIVEISQVKGTSETHPRLSPDDAWADFAIYEHMVGSEPGSQKIQPTGSYVRDAYKTGLERQQSQGFNPYKFGVVGSSDSHNGNVAVEESAFTGKVGLLDGSVERRRKDGFTKIWSASGLAAVWAEENTRESIFDALQRRETFATSGTRISIRFFSGWSLPKGLLKSHDASTQAYQYGVPMGGELAAAEQSDAPEFLIWALQDPHAAPLQRLQIVKAWSEDGISKEQVFDVACASGQPSANNHRCPDTVTTLNVDTCEWSSSEGVSNLSVFWRDPDFNPNSPALYYVRALEIPSCHWSTWDAIHNNLPLVNGAPVSIQERAWSSPIWYRPE